MQFAPRYTRLNPVLKMPNLFIPYKITVFKTVFPTPALFFKLSWFAQQILLSHDPFLLLFDQLSESYLF